MKYSRLFALRVRALLQRVLVFATKPVFATNRAATVRERFPQRVSSDAAANDARRDLAAHNTGTHARATGVHAPAHNTGAHAAASDGGRHVAARNSGRTVGARHCLAGGAACNAQPHLRRPLLSVLLAALLSTGPGLAQQFPQVSVDQQLPRMTRPLVLENSTRLRDLMRSGNIYLSLQDALALAIENNLDIELQRFLLPQGDTELLRAKGGGTTRGLNYTLSEAPTGVGGPLSPLVTNPGPTGSATNGTSVPTNALELGVLGEPQTNFSTQGTVVQSTGTPVPVYDPAIVGQLNWSHQTTPQTNLLSAGNNALVTNGFIANAGVQQGFASGGQVSLNFDNTHQNVNALNTAYNPYTGSSLGLTVTQPLLRGFGLSLNRRFIRIAGNERKITSLLFQQQLIATVYGVVRLYTDLVALYQDEKVKEETVRLANKLLADTNAQVEEGTLAPVEATRANAQVFATQQDLINARGLLEEQEAIIKSLLTRTEDSAIRAAHIIPTGTLDIPPADEIRPIQDLINEAMANRPDLGQARLQVENSIIGLQGSKNATLPEVDLVGVAQNNGLAGATTGLVSNPNAPFAGGYGGALGQVLARDYPTYGIGVQVTLPIHNRIAEADLARDELNTRQAQVRVVQLQNQAKLEVEDALIAMRRARAAYEAAVQARKFQEQSLDAEQAKFEVGASTAFFVIQYESLLAQARSTEVAARSSYVKAKAALQRATGSILSDNNISIDAAIKGKM